MLFDGTAENDNITGTSGDDTLNGFDGNDTLSGEGGNDSLVGGEGGDRIDAGTGNDTLLGESGDDTFIFGAGAKTVDGGDGNDRLDLDFSSESEDFVFTYTEDGSLTTGSFLDGTTVQNVERATIDSGSGNDLINVAATVNNFDDLNGGGGNDTIIGGSGADDIFGELGDDILSGREGNDRIDGGEGNDVAVFLGLRADYEITVEEDSVSVSNSSSTDTLTSIETIRFSDGDFNPANGEFTISDDDGIPVYRFLRTDTQTQFYTTTDVERESVLENLPQYELEGISFIGADIPDDISGGGGATGTIPVYRFFNTSTGIHLYTSDENERAFVENNLDNFVFEGTPYYGYETQVEGTIPLYRFYNAALDAHFYTPSVEERDDFIASPDFEPEGGGDGVAFYVEPAPEL